MIRLARIALASALVAVVPVSLSACWQGNNAPTYEQATQGATGDGTDANSPNGLLGIRAAVIVAKDGYFSIVTTLVNKGTTPDRLVGVQLATGGTNVDIPVPAEGTVSVGQNGDSARILGSGLFAGASAFVPARFIFANGGDVSARLLVRSPEGYWANIRVK